MKTNFKTLLFALVAIFGLFLSSADCKAQAPIENQLLNLFQKTDLANKVIVIKSFKNGKIEYSTQPGWNPGRDDKQKRAGDIVCQGSGISFAKCVRDFVDKSGGCLIYKYKNGDLYVAQKMR